jgi:hypothetical protein
VPFVVEMAVPDFRQDFRGFTGLELSARGIAPCKLLRASAPLREIRLFFLLPISNPLFSPSTPRSPRRLWLTPARAAAAKFAQPVFALFASLARNWLLLSEPDPLDRIHRIFQDSQDFDPFEQFVPFVVEMAVPDFRQDFRGFTGLELPARGIAPRKLLRASAPLREIRLFFLLPISNPLFSPSTPRSPRRLWLTPARAAAAKFAQPVFALFASLARTRLSNNPELPRHGKPRP